MSLYEQWKELASEQRSETEYEVFWKAYFDKEKKNYEYILENHREIISGKLVELAEKFGMDSITFTGFLDGINTSLIESLDMENLNDDSEIRLAIDYEKLYFNMLDAKADWLYGLPQWENILTAEKRTEVTREFRKSKMAVSAKVGRNDPCSCGSGKKYKKCCGS